MKPLVSICIPNYNYGDFLEEAINSALSQTYKNIEVLVVDNCSTDRSWSILKTFGGKIKAYRNKRNLGHVENMNKCIELSRGKYIVILNSDDMLDSKSVEKQVKVMESNPTVGFVHGSTYVVDKDGRILSESRISPENHVVAGEKKLSSLLKGNYVMMPSVMVRKECYEKLGVLDNEIALCPDWDMWLRICMKYDAAYIADFVAFYREHGKTVSNRCNNENIGALDYYKMLNKIFGMTGSRIPTKRKSHYYFILARQQIAKSLHLTIEGKPIHARKYVIASILIDPRFLVLFPLFYTLTFLGKYPSKVFLGIGKMFIN